MSPVTVRPETGGERQRPPVAPAGAEEGFSHNLRVGGPGPALVWVAGAARPSGWRPAGTGQRGPVRKGTVKKGTVLKGPPEP